MRTRTAIPAQHDLSLDDYLALERSGEERYEYHHGRVFAMAGGTHAHSALCNSIATQLTLAAERAGTCYPFNSETKIEIEAAGRYVYPDAGLACPKMNPSEHLVGALTNPSVIVEVVSDGTGNYDRGTKLRLYFSLPSLREYILISQDRAEITIFRRRGDLMRMDVYEGLEAAFPLETIEARITLSDIYRHVDLPDPTDDDLSTDLPRP